MFARPSFMGGGGGGAGPTVDHAAFSSGQIHMLFNWVVANDAAKAAVVPVAGDLYKALYQVDTKATYILSSLSPVTWTPIGSIDAQIGPAFAAYGTGSQNHTGGTTTVINCDVEVHDSHNAYNGTQYVVPVAGVYHFGARATVSGSQINTNSVCFITRNGDGIVAGNQTASGSYGWAAEGDILCAAGDVIKAEFYSDTGMALAGASKQHRYFYGHYVAQRFPGEETGPAFAAYNNAQQNIPGNNAATTLAFNTEEYDTDNAFAANVFTCPKAGIYHFTAGTSLLSATNSTSWLHLTKNGVAKRRGTQTDTAPMYTLTVSGDISLAVGDVVAAQASFSGARTVWNGQELCYFTGHFVRSLP